MGLRLNVATKYEVKYTGASVSFNWMCEDFLLALDRMGIEYSSASSEDPCSDLEISVDEAKLFLKQHQDESKDFRSKTIITKTDYSNCSNTITVQDLYDVLTNALKDGDTRDGWIHFAWF